MFERVQKLCYGMAMLLVSMGIIIDAFEIDVHFSFFRYAMMSILLYILLMYIPTMKASTKELFYFAVILLLSVAVMGTTEIDSINEVIELSIGLLLLNVVKNRSFQVSTGKIFLLIGTLSAVLFLYVFFFTEPQYWYFGERKLGSVGISSNGVWAFLFMGVVVLAMDYFSSVFANIICIILCIGLFDIAVETGSRGSIVSMIALILCRLLPKLRLFRTKVVAALAAMIPCAVSVVSVVLYKMGLFRNAYNGTLLNLREIIWINVFNRSVLKLLFGGLGDKAFYTHNVFVQHTYRFGIIVAIIFIIAVYVALKSVCIDINEQSRIKYDAYIIFACSLLHASIENSILGSGAGGALLYTYSFLLIASSDICEKNRGLLPTIKIGERYFIIL